MSKLNEESESISRHSDRVEGNGSGNGNGREKAEATKEESPEGIEGKNSPRGEDDQKEILKFTMLINKFNSDLNVKRNQDQERQKRDLKCAMFFNKEVTIRPNVVEHHPPPSPPPSPLTVKSLEPGKRNPEKNSIKQPVKPSDRFNGIERFDWVEKPTEIQFWKLRTSEPDLFSPADRDSSDGTRPTKPAGNRIRGGGGGGGAEEEEGEGEEGAGKNVGKFFPGGKSSNHRQEVRIHNSLTSLSAKNSTLLKSGLREAVLKSKIPSLTAIETGRSAASSALPAAAAAHHQKSGLTKFGRWEDRNGLEAVVHRRTEEGGNRFSLQISKSANENHPRRSAAIKFKREESASFSDSKLSIRSDSEIKKQFKKSSDKKSRGDSSRREREIGSGRGGGGSGSLAAAPGGGRKQVQWKAEVDVIYFSTQEAANGDRSREVVGRVTEPLREEWEQQRKGFYAKIVSYHMESHLKDHFISLLKI